VQISTPSCHGKVMAGWTLPEGSPAGIRDAMYQRVQEMVDEVVARSTKRKRADSISHVFVGWVDVVDVRELVLSQMRIAAN